MALKIFTPKFAFLSKFIIPAIGGCITVTSVIWGYAQTNAYEKISKKAKLDSLSIVAKQTLFTKQAVDTIVVSLKEIKKELISNQNKTNKIFDALETHVNKSINKDDIIEFYKIMKETSLFEKRTSLNIIDTINPLIVNDSINNEKKNFCLESKIQKTIPIDSIQLVNQIPSDTSKTHSLNIYCLSYGKKSIQEVILESIQKTQLFQKQTQQLLQQNELKKMP